jgi:hypothetical protein
MKSAVMRGSYTALILTLWLVSTVWGSTAFIDFDSLDDIYRETFYTEYGHAYASAYCQGGATFTPTKAGSFWLQGSAGISFDIWLDPASLGYFLHYREKGPDSLQFNVRSLCARALLGVDQRETDNLRFSQITWTTLDDNENRTELDLCEEDNEWPIVPPNAPPDALANATGHFTTGLGPIIAGGTVTMPLTWYSQVDEEGNYGLPGTTYWQCTGGVTLNIPVPWTMEGTVVDISKPIPLPSSLLLLSSGLLGLGGWRRLRKS